MEKIKEFKKIFKKNGVDGYIIPKNDEYFNEYIPKHNDRLNFISNFSGSYGFALILKGKNYLFVDGRYTLQANNQCGKHFKIITIPGKMPSDILKEKSISIGLTQKDIIGKPSRSAWSDLADLFEYNLLPSFYNPSNFSPFYVGKEMVIKEDEFSSPKLNFENFKSFVLTRNIDTNHISFEITKSIISNFEEVNDEMNNFYLFSKIGTPVFTAFDPSPYDPLNERDTLKTGSMTEVKTSGNWK